MRLVPFFFVVACVGQIEGGVRVIEPVAEPEKPVVCTPMLPSLPKRLVRLDAAAYKRTIQTLFNWRGQYFDVPVDPPLPFTRSNPGDPFTTFAASYGVNEFDLEELIVASRTVGEMYAPYIASKGDTCLNKPVITIECQRGQINSYIERLYNRRATRAELDEVMAELAADQASGLTTFKSLELALRRLLMSPEMAFRAELGGASGLDSYERAKLLSYGLIGVPPDRKMWELAGAADGGLMNEADVRSEVQRLVAKPETLASLRRFLREYFKIESVLTVTKDPKASYFQPGFMVQDAERTIEHQLTMHARSGLLRALLTSEQVHVSSETGDLWKPAGPERGILTMPGRPGILTQPGWLSGFSEMTHNNLVRRGRFIRERLLCTPVPQLPAGLFPTIPEHAGLTFRARLEQQTAADGCQGCHKAMNSLGGAFEGFDHFGRVQTSDNGAAVDTSGVLDVPGAPDVAFANPTQLMQALASSPTVHDCFLTNLFSFYVGRAPTREDVCELERVKAVYRESGEDTLAVIEELFVWQATTQRIEVEP